MKAVTKTRSFRGDETGRVEIAEERSLCAACLATHTVAHHTEYLVKREGGREEWIPVST